jgi:hypothetical protein
MNEYDNIIATLDRIIAMQDRMIEKIEEINNILSENKLNDDAVVSMREKWDTTGPR